MVRYVQPYQSRVEDSKNNGQSKSSICQPKDNIGISGTFSTGGNPASGDKPSTGLRRKYAIPKDNLGVACLPSSETWAGLRDIPEEEPADIYKKNTECDEAVRGVRDEDDVVKVEEEKEKEKKESPSNVTKITGRARCIAPRDNLSSSCRHVDNVAPQVRLRAGEDSGQVTHGEIQDRFDVCGRSRIKRAGLSKPRGDTNIFGVYSDEYVPPVPPVKKSQSKPSDVGISNIRRPKHDPNQPRKLIVPKDNIGFSGRHLQKSSSRSGGPKTREIISSKETKACKSFGTKNLALNSSLSINTSDKQTSTISQVKSLKAVSELTNRDKQN